MLRMKQQYFFHLRHAADGAQEVQKALRRRFQPPAREGGLPYQRHAPRPRHPRADAAVDRPGGPGLGLGASIVNRCFAYTNHTVMQEALERWPQEMMKQTLPRVYMILEEMNRRLCDEAVQGLSRPVGPHRAHGDPRLRAGADGQPLRVASYSVNAVSQLHGKILTDGLFHDYWLLKPRQVHRHHQRHHAPPVAALGQSGAFGPD